MMSSGEHRATGRVAGGDPGQGPRFDASVPNDGYLWWYLDGVSSDGRFACTVIAFIGSVFSPFYRSARGRGPSDPANHCCMHVVLYGPRQQRWAMTERGTADLQQSAQSLVIGPSAMRWDGSMLTIDVDEVCTPIPRRLKGQIRLRVDRVYDAAWYLDPEQLHRWWPINPSAQLEVELEYPDIRWSGKGYFDCNDGKVPLENSFRYWNWSSAPLAAGGAAILYAVVGRDGQARDLALHYGANGTIGDFEPGSVVNLPSTRWGVKRQTHCHDTDRPRVIWSLVDSPFYSRSVLSTELMGEPVVAVHESLDLDRFVSPVVQKMLPFRVARKAG